MSEELSKALYNFASKSVKIDFLMVMTARVLQKLKDNDLFPTVAEEVEELRKKYDAYVKAVSEASKGSAVQKSEARELKEDVQKALRDVCDAVNFVAKGRRKMLESTGFDLNKETHTNTVLGPIEEFTINQGQAEGSLVTSFRNQKGIKGSGIDWKYVDQEDAEQWQVHKANGCTALLTGFPPGKTLILRAWITGPRNQLIYSLPVKAVTGFDKTSNKKGK